MNRTVIRSVAALALVGLGACDLKVQNPNQPETERVLASSTDVESLLGTYYRRWHSGMYGSTANVALMMGVQSFENYSSLSNNCLGQRVGIPRAANDNAIGNPCGPEQVRVYNYMSEVNRVSSSILATLDKSGFTLGSTAQDNRARSFAQFLRGMSLGYMAMVHDSAAITDPTTGAEEAGELKGYPEVAAAAMDAFDKSITAANAGGAGSGGFPLPASWIPSSTSFTAPEFVRLVRSYRARIRANMARTPAERAAVNWDLVIADAQAGITADHDNITNTINGPFDTPRAQLYSYTTWHQMTPFVIGMADNSGSYAAWIAKSLAERGSDGAFFMTTPDLRFPQGATRAAQQADFPITQCNGASTVCKRYFVNRATGSDNFSGNGWGWSNYDHARFFSWRTSGDATGQNGKLVFMTKTEIDLLQAEGQYHKNNLAAVLTLVNASRVRSGLPALTAADKTTQVPGGADCVPKVPVGPAFTTIACGNLFEALKYEKRMETAYTHFGAWFFDMRGWGDLAAGTGTDWPVPYQDLQARGRTSDLIYSTGGANTHSAARGTYGW